jgi:peptide/nickel transport system permease protein
MSAQASVGRVPDVVLRGLVRQRQVERRWARSTLYAGVGLLAVAVLAVLLHPLFGLPSPNAQDYNHTLQGPSLSHPFGTDDVGRDILSRVLSGLGLDLRVAVEVTALSILVGVTAGAVAGHLGGWVENLTMRLADVVLAIPFLVLVLALVAVLGSGLKGVYVAVPVTGWAVYARFTRGEMLTIREMDFVNAATTLGYSRRRILFRHALPNAIRPAVVYGSMDMILNIGTVAALSFLGLGVAPPTPELGGIIAEGQDYIFTAWWITTLPGLVLVFVGLGFALLGDGLAEALGKDVAWTK